MPRPLASQELEDAILAFNAVEARVDTLKEQLAAARADAKQLGETTIPDLLDEVTRHQGVSLTNGDEYTFQLDVKCGVAEKDKEDAFGWLASKNADAMLKRQIILTLGKDSARVAANIKTLLARVLPQYEIGIKVGESPATLVSAVQTLLAEAGLTPTVTVSEKLSIDGSTLSAFVKKSLKSGVSLPESFGVYAPMRPICMAPTPPDAGETLATQLEAELP